MANLCIVLYFSLIEWLRDRGKEKERSSSNYNVVCWVGVYFIPLGTIKISKKGFFLIFFIFFIYIYIHFSCYSSLEMCIV